MIFRASIRASSDVAWAIFLMLMRFLQEGHSAVVFSSGMMRKLATAAGFQAKRKWRPRVPGRGQRRRCTAANGEPALCGLRHREAARPAEEGRSPPGGTPNAPFTNCQGLAVNSALEQRGGDRQWQQQRNGWPQGGAPVIAVLTEGELAKVAQQGYASAASTDHDTSPERSAPSSATALSRGRRSLR